MLALRCSENGATFHSIGINVHMRTLFTYIWGADLRHSSSQLTEQMYISTECMRSVYSRGSLVALSLVFFICSYIVSVWVSQSSQHYCHIVNFTHICVHLYKYTIHPKPIRIHQKVMDWTRARSPFTSLEICYINKKDQPLVVCTSDVLS